MKPPRAFVSRSFQYSLLFLCLPDVVTKYSNFVSFPLYLNGRRMNTLQVRPAACGLGGHETELLPVGPARQRGLGVAVRAPGWGVGAGRVVRSVGTPGSHLHGPHPALLAVFSHSALSTVSSGTGHPGPPQKETPHRQQPLP